jgi:hypothetical protein
MLSTALNRIVVLTIAFAAFCAVAGEREPRTLRVPVVGLLYEVAKTKFEPLPADVLRKCPTMSDNENMRSSFWIYASTQEGPRTYYLVGGYGIRTHAAPPDFPRYEPLDLGTVFQIDGDACKVFGDALEVFQTRYFEETSQQVLQKLADNLVLRLSKAFGGRAKLGAELRRQRLNPAIVSPELNEAFSGASTND